MLSTASGVKAMVLAWRILKLDVNYVKFENGKDM